MSKHLLACSVAACTMALQPASASATDHCRARSGEATKAKSDRAVLLYAKRTGRLIGCSRYTGRRRVLETLSPRSSLTFSSIQLSGTRAGWVARDYDRSQGTTEEIFVEDALRPNGPRKIAGPQWTPSYGTVTSLAVSARGAVAWIVASPVGDSVQRSLFLSEHAGDVRRIDRGFALRMAQLSLGMLRWRHGMQPMQQRVPLLPSACGARMNTGTQELDVYVLPKAVTICRRSDGRNATIDVSEPAAVDLNGTQALISSAEPEDRSHGHLTLVDLGAATQRTIPTGTWPYSPVITPAGPAWVESSNHAGASSEIWIEDAGGKRRVATLTGSVRLAVDGTTARWGPTSSITLSAEVADSP